MRTMLSECTGWNLICYTKKKKKKKKTQMSILGRLRYSRNHLTPVGEFNILLQFFLIWKIVFVLIRVTIKIISVFSCFKEVDSAPSMYLGYRLCDSEGNLVPNQNGVYNRRRTADLTRGQLATCAFHQVSLKNVFAFDLTLYLDILRWLIWHVG